MATSFQQFKDLHSSGALLLLPNAWDARSAILFEECGYPAIATSSAAVANSLGYEDGENMSFTDYLFVIRRILSSVKVPLTVDLEKGYGKNDEEIAENVLRLATLGVAGINIEDSKIGESKQSLKGHSEFSKTIRHIKNALATKHLELFINIRCDTYILNVDDKLNETIGRINAYNSTGADGIFVPCIHNQLDIAEVVRHSKLPVNVMCFPGLPGLDELTELGVKRVSMGPFMFQRVYDQIGKLTQNIHATRSISSLLS